MKFVVAKAFAGLFLFLEGFVIGYIYLTEHTTPLLLVLAVPSVIAGVVLLISAAKSNNIMKHVTEEQQSEPAEESIVIDTTKGESILERNNNIMNDWSKTYETREKLKMLKIAASAAEKEKP